MRIAVVGAGAIGTWIGAALSRAGDDVALIARGAHLDAMRAGGVTVAGSEAYTVRPLATDSASEVGPVDLVVLAVKAHDQPAAGPLVAALLGPDTVVLAAQNGIPWWYFHALPGPYEGRRVEAADPGGAVSAAIAPERALGLVVYMGASLGPPGTVNVRPEAGLVIGEPSGESSARLARVAAALEAAGFPVRQSADIRTDLWTKLMGNASFNPISVLTRGGLGTIATHPGTRDVVAQMMEEARAIARATGADPTMSIPDRLAITARLGDHKTSTLQDAEAGKRIELDAVLGAVVELATLTGTPAPTLTTVLALTDLHAQVHGLR
jgi:2-dehydropantoate 2-reductase